MQGWAACGGGEEESGPGGGRKRRERGRMVEVGGYEGRWMMNERKDGTGVILG